MVVTAAVLARLLGAVVFGSDGSLFRGTDAGFLVRPELRHL